MIVVKFEPKHAIQINLQPAQRETVGIITPDYACALANAGESYTVMVEDKIVFCGGVAKIWPGRGLLWALLSDAAASHMLSLTKGVRKFISLQTGRVETVVRSNFEQGHRWAVMCGLKWHHREEKYLPDGNDADIYVRFC